MSQNSSRPLDSEPRPDGLAMNDGLPVPRRIWAVIAISFAMALFIIDGGIANVALPTIARELDVSDSNVTNIVTVYQLVMLMVLMPLAKLGERIGYRRLFQFGQVLFIVSSLAVILVDSFAMLLLIRVGQAIGAGMGLSVAAAMVREIYPENKLGAGLGLNSVITASAASLAPTLGGYIVAHFAWQWVFFAAAPFALLSLLLARALPDPIERNIPLEWKSSAWMALTMLLLVGGVQVATHGGHFSLVIAMALLGVASGFRLVRRERQRPNPVFPVDLLGRPVLGLTVLAGFACFMAIATLFISLPFRLDRVGFGPDEIGLLLIPFPVTLIFISPLAGWLSDRIAPTKLGVTGMAVAIVGFLLMAFLPEQADKLAISWRMSVCALGVGLFLTPNSKILISMSPRERAAAAGSLLSSSRMLGQTIAAATVGLLLASGLGVGPVPMLLACALAILAASCSLTRFITVRRHGIR